MPLSETLGPLMARMQDAFGPVSNSPGAAQSNALGGPLSASTAPPAPSNPSPAQLAPDLPNLNTQLGPYIQPGSNPVTTEELSLVPGHISHFMNHVANNPQMGDTYDKIYQQVQNGTPLHEVYGSAVPKDQLVQNLPPINPQLATQAPPTSPEQTAGGQPSIQAQTPQIPTAPPPMDFGAEQATVAHIKQIMDQMAGTTPPQYMPPHMNLLQGALGALAAMLDRRGAARDVQGLATGITTNAQDQYKNALTGYTAQRQGLAEQLGAAQDQARLQQGMTTAQGSENERAYQAQMQGYDRAVALGDKQKQEAIANVIRLQQMYDSPTVPRSQMDSLARQITDQAAKAGIPVAPLDPERDYQRQQAKQTTAAVNEWGSTVQRYVNEYGFVSDTAARNLEDVRQSIAAAYGIDARSLLPPTTEKTRWQLSEQDKIALASASRAAHHAEFEQALGARLKIHAGSMADAAASLDVRQHELALNIDKFKFEVQHGNQLQAYKELNDVFNNKVKAAQDYNRSLEGAIADARKAAAADIKTGMPQVNTPEWQQYMDDQQRITNLQARRVPVPSADDLTSALSAQGLLPSQTVAQTPPGLVGDHPTGLGLLPDSRPLSGLSGNIGPKPGKAQRLKAKKGGNTAPAAVTLPPGWGTR